MVRYLFGILILLLLGCSFVPVNGSVSAYNSPLYIPIVINEIFTETPTVTVTPTVNRLRNFIPNINKPYNTVTPTVTNTMTPTPTNTPIVLICTELFYCYADIYNCDSFETNDDAQMAYNYCNKVVGYDIHKLDADYDRLACEDY